MRDFHYMFKREDVVADGVLFHLTTHSVDATTWAIAYTKGIREPNHPLPVTIGNAETATNWLILSSCPHIGGPCWACLDKWEDQMIWDFPFLN